MMEANSRLSEDTSGVVLRVDDLKVNFHAPRTFSEFVRHKPKRQVRAVDGVSLTIKQYETLGLVGESGSGKTTLGRALLRLYPPTSGQVIFFGQNLEYLDESELRVVRRDMQMVFQDPYSSLNRRMTVGQTLSEVLRFHGVCATEDVSQEVAQLLELVGLAADMVTRYPKSLSGGQRQRVGLARALAVRPRFLVLDEPVAALDVSIQAQILNLLDDLRNELGLTMLFIAHELSVVRHVSTRVAVMYLGTIVEIGSTEEIFSTPSHPYTQSLMKAVPRLEAKRRERSAVLKGDVPSALDIPTGCRFHPRCLRAEDICRREEPTVKSFGLTQQSICHFADDVRNSWGDRTHQ